MPYNYSIPRKTFMSNDVAAWLNEAGRRRLGPEQTEALLQRLSGLKEGTAKYRRTFDRIVEGNLLLVASTVEKLMRRSHSLHWGGPLTVDLLQVGCLGLSLTVQRFDVTRGTKLSTCAVPWIRQRVSRWLSGHLSAIYVPENTLRAAYAAYRGEKPGKIAPKDPAITLRAMQVLNMTSLDARISKSQEGATLGEIIPSPGEEEKPRSQSESIKMLRDVMAKAGIEPHTQDLMLAYAECGRIDTSARRVNMGSNKASRVIKTAIARCQEVI